MVSMPEGLTKMSACAELVCKARVLSIIGATNTGVREVPSYPVAVATLQIISILKGDPQTNVVRFEYYTEGPPAFGRSYSPQHYELDPGQCYIFFALNAGRRGAFQPIRESHTLKQDEGVTRTLDARPLTGMDIPAAHWMELSLLLTNRASSNNLYAVRQFDAMSQHCPQDSAHPGDFPRDAVLNAFLPLCSSPNEEVAVAALKSFHGSRECHSSIAPFVSTLIQIADHGGTVSRRSAAIAALSGAPWINISNAVTRWLRDPIPEARLQAVRLLPEYQFGVVEDALRDRAKDESAAVRAAVADAIGEGKFVKLLPVLEMLLDDPVGRPRPVPPLGIEDLRAGARVDLEGHVHTSAGFALMKFDLDQVDSLLRARLSDPEFRPNYLCKLAERDAGPWLDDLTGVLEKRRLQKEREAADSGVEPRANYLKALMALAGTAHKCWHLIYNHLLALPSGAFTGGKLARHLDALENAGDTGSYEPTALYELYRLKKLDDRAARFREAAEKNASYDISFYFKRVDSKLASTRDAAR
jgi:hypothetical protein